METINKKDEVKPNVVLDFTRNQTIENQEVAIMPAALAKKCLKLMAERLADVTEEQIVRTLASDILANKTVKHSVAICMNFVNERALIDNIMAGNWDVYNVESKEVGVIEVAPESTKQPD